MKQTTGYSPFKILITFIAIFFAAMIASHAHAEESVKIASQLPEHLQQLDQLKTQQRELEKTIAQEVDDLKQLQLRMNPPPPEPSNKDVAINFGVVYGAQWAVYLVTQHDAIEKEGSWDNFTSYPLRPDFDKDTFDYNIFKHALSGNYYYLFYRSQGYDELQAFKWTFISSLAFEFAVETYTERPSYQDIYQTPIYGTLVGMGAERLSHYLLKQDTALTTTLGYIVNPFEMIKSLKKAGIVSMPVIDKDSLGMIASWQF